MTTCVRYGADLTKPPHVKLCWQGVPGAYLAGEKGDLCDPCHRAWEAERNPSPALKQCDQRCDKPSCGERCVLPLGHLGYHSCPGPNAAERARGQT